MLAPYTAPTMFDPLVGLEPEQRIPPVEFRVFTQGVNITEKGDFLFDSDAAASVMTAWADRKIDLTVDYEHQALAEPPVEAPNAATRWVPQIRNGELWATEVKWTDRALCYLQAGEYRYFSPAFEYDQKNRVKKLINLALTNNPAMRGLTPLVAASQNAKEPVMEFEKLYNELKAAHEKLTADHAALSAQVTTLTAQLAAKKPPFDDEEEEDTKKEKATILTALSLPTSARASERAQAVSRVAALRTNVMAITGTDSEAGAIGLIHAWKDSHQQVVKLTAKLEELETSQLNTEFEGILDQLGKAGKLEPAARVELKTQALKMCGGRLTKEAVEMARVYLNARPTQVTTQAAAGTQPATDVGQLHPLQLHIAQVCGRDPKELLARTP